MQKQRLFVGNLPSNASNEDVLQLFKKFEVSNVEIRRKNGIDCEVVFAHVDVPNKSVDECLRQFQNHAWKDRVLKIEIAKENFLDRLKRERIQKTIKLSTSKTTSLCLDFPVLNGISENKKIKFSEIDGTDELNVSQNFVTTSELNHVTDVPKKRNLPMFRGIGVLEEETKNDHSEIKSQSSDSFRNAEKNAVISMEKFEAFSDFWKDDESSDCFNYTNNPVKLNKIENNSKNETNSQSEKNQNLKHFSDVKRRSALKEKWNSYKEKQNLIQNALKKITSYNDQDLHNVTNDSIENQKPQGKKITLFEEDSSGDDEFEPNFEVKPYLTGEKGLKMLNLKTKLAFDDRFKLDDRFFDTDMDVDETASVRNKTNNRPIIHYDPTIEDSKTSGKISSTSSLLVSKKKKAKKSTDSKENSLTSIKEVTKPEVSKDKYYVVSDSLKDAFKKAEDQPSFSLTALFDQQLKSTCQTSIIDAETDLVLSKKSKLVKNPLENDSESEAENIELDDETPLEVLPVVTPAEKVLGKCGVWGETLFFKLNDSRLKEAELFYRHPNKIETNDFDKRRTKLKSIVRKKIQNSMRDRKLFKHKLGGKINRNKLKMRLKKIGAR